MATADDYETYVAEAQQATMKGWDFSWLNGRADGGGPSWRSNLPPGPFDLVLNRHGVLDAARIRTALAPGGRLLTQQVGSRKLELNETLGVPAPADPDSWTLDVAVRALEDAGLRVATAREEMSPYTFHDIGAVIFQLRAIPWQFPGFELSEHESALRRLDRRIRIAGGFTVHDHRFLIEAQAGRWSAVEPGRAAVDVPPGRCPH
ncbi:hypothetical protein OG765_32815 [Streptomyces sp. NBC_00555]|uniref:hypothetical protein n=1 Tax=Streptomyces sp. NBC_00555 TaxID=2903662 RepID=UPI0022587FCD|nr:hypothetical protein [Streptomyces sp. NBC_00555]MCX5015704.1 hypothetical protein [Streptomyces sp. NBC_00555]